MVIIIRLNCIIVNRFNTAQIEGNWIANYLKNYIYLAKLITNYVVMYKNSLKIYENGYIFVWLSTQTNKTTHDFDSCRRVSVYICISTLEGTKWTSTSALRSPWPWFSIHRTSAWLSSASWWCRSRCAHQMCCMRSASSSSSCFWLGAWRLSFVIALYS